MRKVFGGSIIKIWFERQPIFAAKVKTKHFSALFVNIVWLVVMRCWRWRPPGVVIFQLIDRLVQFGTRINCRPLRTNLLSLTLASASANFCFGAAFFFFGHCRPICRPITLQSYRSHFHLFCRRRPAAIKSRRTFHAVDISCFFSAAPKKKKKVADWGPLKETFCLCSNLILSAITKVIVRRKIDTFQIFFLNRLCLSPK